MKKGKSETYADRGYLGPLCGACGVPWLPICSELNDGAQ